MIDTLPPEPSADGLSPELRRRNLQLGLLLGGLCLASTILYIIIFTRTGLPKDPDEWRRQQAHHQAEAADPHAESTAP
jgi:hypothetical protein